MRSTKLGTVILLALGSSVALSAEEAVPVAFESLSSRFMLDVGGFFPTLSTKARLDSPTLGRGTEISFEDDLDFSDREALVFGQFTARLATRWRLQLDYIDLSRSTTKTLERQIEWGDDVYEIGATVGAYFDVTIVRLAFGYSFWRKSDWELGATFGAHVMDVGAGLGLRVESGGGAIDWGTEADIGGLAPLPNFGLYWAWAFAERWAMSARGDFFAIEIDEFGGNLMAGAVNVHYVVSKNFSIGAGYSVFDLSADVTKTHWNGSFEFGYNGPRLFAGVQF
jgi:hypothetical protein